MKFMKFKKIGTGGKLAIGAAVAAVAIFFLARKVGAASNELEIGIKNAPSDSSWKWTVQVYDQENTPIQLKNPGNQGDITKYANETCKFTVLHDNTYPLKLVLVEQVIAGSVNQLRQSLGQEYAPSWGEYDPDFVIPQIGKYTIDYVTGAIS